MHDQRDETVPPKPLVPSFLSSFVVHTMHLMHP